MKVFVLQVAKCFNAEHSFYFRLLGKSFNRWKIVSWQLGDHTNGDYVLSWGRRQRLHIVRILSVSTEEQLFLKLLSDKENESVDNWDGKLTELACASQLTIDPASALININTKRIYFFSV